MEHTAKTVIERLEEAGFEAFLVGGCVRDRLMSRPVHDFDVATSALPEQVIGLFGRTLPTGLKHGTVTVVIEGVPIEVTTFRTESGYADHRRPSSVSFVSSLTEDLRRRDFTINAIAMDRSGQLVDPFGGQLDLKRKLIRSVGDPLERFEEDALRLMRCIRFAANFGFAIEERTWNGLLVKAPLLVHVAMERVETELSKTIAGSDPLRGLQLSIRSGLFKHTKASLGPMADWQEAAIPAVFDRWVTLAEQNIRWAFLLIAMGTEAEDAILVMKSLVFSKRRTEEVAKLIELDQAIRKELTETDNALLTDERIMAIRQLFKRSVLIAGSEPARSWLAINRLLLDIRPKAATSLYRLIDDHGEAWLAEIRLWDRTQLALSGAELAEAWKRTPGPWVSWLLDKLLTDTALGMVDNHYSSLLKRANQYADELEMR